MDLPGELRSAVRGGTPLWEKAQVAWEMRESLPEFEDRPQEQQDWLVAVWRTRAKVDAIEAIRRWRERKK